jgi:hypothetical protein
MQLDDMLGGRSNNPRKGNYDGTQLQMITEESKKKGGVTSPKSAAVSGGNQLSIDNMAKFKQNMDFFRQNDAMEEK